jgi:hypothetical protein
MLFFTTTNTTTTQLVHHSGSRMAAGVIMEYSLYMICDKPQSAATSDYY